jgi:AbrB family looped-hinge helix DNA binding protein
VSIDKDFILAKNKDMAKVTSKLQVTIPKAVATQIGIKPGDEFDWTVAGDIVRLTPSRQLRRRLSVADRLKLFDQATARQRARNRRGSPSRNTDGRGWSREELYERGRAS